MTYWRTVICTLLKFVMEGRDRECNICDPVHGLHLLIAHAILKITLRRKCKLCSDAYKNRKEVIQI